MAIKYEDHHNPISPYQPPPPETPQEPYYSQEMIARIMTEHRRVCLLNYAALASAAKLFAYELEIGSHLVDLARSFGMDVELQKLVVGELAAEVMGL